MIAPIEFAHLSQDVVLWHRYDAKVKADLFATAIDTASGVFLVDPFAVDYAELRRELGERNVSGVVVTNANHARSCREFAVEFSVPLHASHAAAADLGCATFIAIGDGKKLSRDLTTHAIAGAAPGEIALHCDRGAGTIIVGDALINFGSHAFSFLPRKYCVDQDLMRESLRKLLELPFERIFFAHGEPILTRGRARLEALLAE